MCLYPWIIKNKKYTPNKKNGGIVPTVKDRRVLATPIGCGFCIECKNKEARDWQVRLTEEVRTETNGKFVTLTFSNESIKEIEKIINNGDTKIEGYELDNAIATYAIRDFCETWRSHDRKRQKNRKGKAIRHWFITELGHKGTENIHLHGIVWTNEKAEEIRRAWKWGYSWIGKKNDGGEYKSYVNTKTVNYIIKYVKKMDFDHMYFRPKILCSAGIGKKYMERFDSKLNKYKENKTDEAYTTDSGHKLGLPIYYRNKIYTEEEREKLWIEKLDKNVRYVLGEKIDVSKNYNDYYEALKWARMKNDRLGYLSGRIDWDKKKYEEQRRVMLTNKRIERTQEIQEVGEIDNKWNYQSLEKWK